MITTVAILLSAFLGVVYGYGLGHARAEYKIEKMLRCRGAVRLGPKVYQVTLRSDAPRRPF